MVMTTTVGIPVPTPVRILNVTGSSAGNENGNIEIRQNAMGAQGRIIPYNNVNFIVFDAPVDNELWLVGNLNPTARPVIGAFWANASGAFNAGQFRIQGVFIRTQAQ